MLPNTPLPLRRPGFLKVYRLLKQLPDETYCVWQRIDTESGPAPDFLILREDKCSLLITVSEATPHDVDNQLNPTLFAHMEPTENRFIPIGKSEEQSSVSFLQRLETDELQSSKDGRTPACAICFPHLPHTMLNSVRREGSDTDLAWLHKEVLRPETFPAWIEAHLSAPLSQGRVEQLRRAFTPEVIIPQALTIRQPRERNTGAKLTDYLLDVHQESALKADLQLSPEARSATHALRLNLVTGVAGSGKSLILIYRIHLLRRAFAEKPCRMLVLTHNRALIHDLEHKYQRLSQEDRSVTWRTFMGLCHHHWPAATPWNDPLSVTERLQVIRRIRQRYLDRTAVTETMLRDEIDWYKDSMLFNRHDYLDADRTGRGFALPITMRKRVFDAIEAYQNELTARKTMDWGDVPRRIWHAIQNGEIAPPCYHAVFIDEAQFFAPIWFEIIKRMIEPAAGQLFVAADPTQGFLKRRQSWQMSGLDVRGHATRLNRCYRTSPSILNFASLLYRTRMPDDDETPIDIRAPDLPQGVAPFIIPLTSDQDEMTRVVNEIKALTGKGCPLGHILIIYTDGRRREALFQRLRRAFDPTDVVDPRERSADANTLRVCSLNAVTGLESPIVFLMGVHALYEQEQSIRLSDEERAEWVRDNTRKLYMAITRAGQRLVLTYVGELPEHLKKVAT